MQRPHRALVEVVSSFGVASLTTVPLYSTWEPDLQVISYGYFGAGRYPPYHSPQYHGTRLG